MVWGATKGIMAIYLGIERLSAFIRFHLRLIRPYFRAVAGAQSNAC
jgi:hypothetical protein